MPKCPSFVLNFTRPIQGNDKVYGAGMWEVGGRMEWNGRFTHLIAVEESREKAILALRHQLDQLGCEVVNEFS